MQKNTSIDKKNSRNHKGYGLHFKNQSVKLRRQLPGVSADTIRLTTCVVKSYNKLRFYAIRGQWNAGLQFK